jgi:NAD(P)-dependent dehydrogenase (short-subunit alcohol dehydrogenase family)
MLILITGVTRGLGRALAEWYIAAGHTVIGCGRNGAEIFDLRFTYSEPHLFDAIDVTEPVKVDIWCERVQGVCGVPDIVINCAALMNTPAPLWKVPAQEFSKLIDVNIKGTANILRAFLPPMLQRGTGVIVNFSSGWGRSTSPEVAPYCASKYAIEGLTLSLADELPAGMAAIPLNPGIINTDMLRKCMPNDAESYPDAKQWAAKAAPFILGLGAKDNGKSLTVPQA